MSHNRLWLLSRINLRIEKANEPSANASRCTALYKAANGEDFSKAPAPGMFDLKVRTKHIMTTKPPTPLCGFDRTPRN